MFILLFSFSNNFTSIKCMFILFYCFYWMFVFLNIFTLKMRVNVFANSLTFCKVLCYVMFGTYWFTCRIYSIIVTGIYFYQCTTNVNTYRTYFYDNATTNSTTRLTINQYFHLISCNLYFLKNILILILFSSFNVWTTLCTHYYITMKTYFNVINLKKCKVQHSMLSTNFIIWYWYV